MSEYCIEFKIRDFNTKFPYQENTIIFPKEKVIRDLAKLFNLDYFNNECDEEWLIKFIEGMNCKAFKGLLNNYMDNLTSYYESLVYEPKNEV